MRCNYIMIKEWDVITPWLKNGCDYIMINEWDVITSWLKSGMELHHGQIVGWNYIMVKGWM